MKLSFRYAIAAIVMAGALFLLSPTLMPEDVNLPGASRISLGLDLTGGVQLTLGVDTEKAVGPHSSTAGKGFARRPVRPGSPSLAPARCPAACRNSSSPAPTRSMRSLPSPRRTPLKSCPERPVPVPTARSTCPTRSRRPSLSRRRIWPWIRCCVPFLSRTTSLGGGKSDIRKQQGDRILIQLPGLTNVNRAVQLVEKSADLSFHLVRDDISQGYLPPGVAFYPMTGKHGEATNAKLALDSTPLLSGKEVADARPGFDNKNTSMVSLSFTPRGAALFEMATGEHVGKRLAIVLDGTIHSAPVIQEKIAGGTASISGQFTPEEAQDLAISLRSGSLAAPVHVLEQRTVGPALGEASITSGILAALIGTLAVMIIMPLRHAAGPGMGQ